MRAMMLNGGSSKYVTQGRLFDGTNDYATRGAKLTGIADSKTGLLSCWLNFAGKDGFSQIILADGASGAASSLYLIKSSDNKIYLVGRNAAGIAVLSINTSTTYTAATGWIHLLMAWDLQNGIGQIYVNNVNRKAAGGILTNDSLGYSTKTNFGVGGETDGGIRLFANISELLFSTEYADISTATVQDKFSSAGKPISLGATGSLPTGTQPLIYLPYGDPADNKGSGGNLSVVGTLDVSTTSPSD